MPARRAPGQGSLRQRDGRWISQTRHPLTGRTVSKTHPAGTSARTAEKLHAAWIAEVGRSRVARTGVTVAQHLDDWLATRDDVSHATRRTLKSNVRRISDRIGGLRLQELHAGHIDMLMVDLRKTMSPGTVRVTRSTLAAALRRAEAWGRIDRDPMPLVARVRARQPDPVVVPTEGQVRLILAAETDSLWRSMLVVLVGTGMRVGECLSLRWSDVQLDDGVITVGRTVTLDERGRKVVGDTTKTRRARRVTIGDDVVAVLRAWRTELGEAGLWRIKPQALVWESTYRPGRPFGAPALRQHLADAVKTAKADPAITPKSLRHFHASALMAAGVPPQQVADRLGHSIAETMQRYGVHVPDESRRALLAHLPALGAAAAEA